MVYRQSAMNMLSRCNHCNKSPLQCFHSLQYSLLIAMSVLLTSFPDLPTVQFLQYAVMEGGRPGVTWMNHWRGRGSNQKNTFRTRTLHFKPGAKCFSNVRNSSTWGRNYKIRPQTCSFDHGPLPPSVYLGRHWRHSHDKLDQASPLRFFI